MFRRRPTFSFCYALVASFACHADENPQSLATTDTGGSENETGFEPSPGPEAEVEIHTWWRSASESLALDAISRVFQERYPDVVIRLTTIDGMRESSLADLRSRVDADDYPDLFQMLPRDVVLWTEFRTDDDDPEPENLLVPLDELLESTGAAEQIPPSVLTLGQPPDGHIYGAPIGLHRQNGMFLNADLMADLGLTAPRSLPEFEEMCAAVTAYNESLPESEHIFTVANTLQGWALELVYKTIVTATAESMHPGAGGQYLVDFFDGKQSTDDPEYVAAAEFFNTYLACSNQPPAVFSYTCQGGDNDAGYCLVDADCGDGGTCVVRACLGGDNEGTSCFMDSDCPGEGALCTLNYHHEWDFGWNEAADLLSQGRALSFIHGDWVKGEYDTTLLNYDLVPAFGTNDVFIYNVDTLATFANANHPVNARNFMLTALSPEGQAAWSVEKGSTPPRRDAPTDAFDAKSRSTYDDYIEARYIQDTETITMWDLQHPVFRDYWRARYRDGFTPDSEQAQVDLTAFLDASRENYARLKDSLVSPAQP